jgi:hypothetical protein
MNDAKCIGIELCKIVLIVGSKRRNNSWGHATGSYVSITHYNYKFLQVDCTVRAKPFISQSRDTDTSPIPIAPTYGRVVPPSLILDHMYFQRYVQAFGLVSDIVFVFVLCNIFVDLSWIWCFISIVLLIIIFVSFRLSSTRPLQALTMWVARWMYYRIL